MDDDSVDSEAESRLVINTMEIVSKDAQISSDHNDATTEDEAAQEDALCVSQTQMKDCLPSPDENMSEAENVTPSPVQTENIGETYAEEMSAKNATPPVNDSGVIDAINRSSETEGNYYQPEEGELEEGELEDDDDEEIVREPVAPEPSTKPPLIETPNRTQPTDKGGGSKKRSKDKDEDKRHKRRRHHKDEVPSSMGTNKSIFTKEKKEPDFDALLKQELYLRGEASTPEVYPNDDETGESGSGEEWDKMSRRRHGKRRRSKSSSQSPSRKNEAICLFFLQGNCQKGNNCPYSHEMAPTRKLELCKFYMVDRCAKRENCSYMHKDFPCKYYHFGIKCLAGENCKFSHGTLQEPAKNVLCKHIESAPKDILGDFPRLIKNLALNVLSLTLDKRNGTPISNEILQSVIGLEGKGFKYVDKCLKEYKKRMGIENIAKADDRERSSKEVDDKSPKKSSKSKYKNDNKEQERKSGRDRGKSRDRNREDKKDRSKDRHRNRDRVRDRRERSDRNRNRGDSTRNPRKNHYPLAGTQRQRDFFQRIDNINQNPRDDDVPDQEQREQSYEQTKWYSSDEENDKANDGQRYSAEDNTKSPFSQSTKVGISEAPDLKNIDFNYIQQLLNKVQAPASEPSIQYENTYNSREDYPSIRNVEKFSNDLKDVFNDRPISEPISGPRNLTLDLQNLIKTAREKSVITDEQSTFNPTKLYQDSRQLSYEPWKQSQDARQFSPDANLLSKDCRQISQDPRQLSQSPRQISKDPRQLSQDPRQISQDLTKLCQDLRQLSQDPKQDSGDIRPLFQSPKQFPQFSENAAHLQQLNRDPRFNRENSGNWKEEPLLCTPMEDHSKRLESSPYSEILEEPRQPDLDLISIDNQSDSVSTVGDRNSDLDTVASSMYDIDLHQLDAISAAEIDDINSLIFKMPSHTPAKEINGSINANPPMYYQLIEVTVPKPDFSNLRNIQADSRYFEDPRLRLMFRRNSSEEQYSASPKNISRKDSAEYPSTPDESFSDRPSTDLKDSRDPRKQLSRDPRAEGKLMKAAVEPRIDPRVATRNDPRVSNSRGPAMETRNMEEFADPKMTGPMFINGHMDNSMPNISNMAPVQNPYFQMDPRGRPGLLGAAPGHGIPMGLQGPMRHGMPRPPYLLATPNMPPLSFGMDRDDIMMCPPGGLTKGQQTWDAGVAYKDPRMSRDTRQSY